MKIRLLGFGILLTTVTSVIAAEHFQVKFEHIQEGKVIERGNILVSKKPHTWSKGLKLSYLRLRCQQTET